MKRYLFALMITLLVTSLLLAGCGGNSNTQKETLSQTVTSTEAMTETTTEDPLSLNPSLMGIATRYGDLLYPARWKDNLRINSTEKDGIATVEFYATVGSHEEIHLYDVQFDGEEGDCVGAFDFEGQKVYVMLVSSDFEPDKTWTEEEILTVRAMKEDINFLIDELN